MHGYCMDNMDIYIAWHACMDTCKLTGHPRQLLMNTLCPPEWPMTHQPSPQHISPSHLHLSKFTLQNPILQWEWRKCALASSTRMFLNYKWSFDQWFNTLTVPHGRLGWSCPLLIRTDCFKCLDPPFLKIIEVHAIYPRWCMVQGLIQFLEKELCFTAHIPVWYKWKVAQCQSGANSPRPL